MKILQPPLPETNELKRSLAAGKNYINVSKKINEQNISYGGFDILILV